jgi:FkbM family methyltransferase
MLSELLRNLYYAQRARGSFFKKVRLFISLEKLSIRNQFTEQKNQGLNIHAKIFGFFIYSTNYYSLIFLIREIFCSEVYFFQTSSKHPTIIDCGANIGVATIYFKIKFPEARVLAFEPNPYIYQLLEKNIQTNCIKKIELYNLALYDKETDLQFFIPSYLGTLKGSSKEIYGKNIALKVKAKQLSTYIMEMDKIDLIKIDVEGAESNIIDDLITTGTLEKAEQYIVEYHLNMNSDNSSLSEFLAKFESRGFNYSIKANFLKIRNPQDVLIHFYRRVI